VDPAAAKLRAENGAEGGPSAIARMTQGANTE
jgi:hypothetical protein